MDRKINVSMQDVMGKSFPFENLHALYNFIVQERIFWADQSQRLQEKQIPLHLFFHVQNALDPIIKTMNGWAPLLESWDESQFVAQFNTLSPQLNKIKNWLWSGQAHVPAFIDCNEKCGADSALAFHEMLKGGNPQNIGSRKHFDGIMRAYEFLNPESEITKRSQSEKISLEQIRDELSQSKTNLITEVDNLKIGFNHWDLNTKAEWEAWKIQQDGAIDKLHNEKNSEFNQTMGGWQNRITALESKFTELLRLKGPVEQWNKRAKILRWQGGLWAVTLVSVVALALFYSHEFFILWLQGQESPIKLNSIQGAVIFASILSFFAVIIRALSRLTFSAFHLQRDAEEKAQLAYVYLALIDETEDDLESKKIILQSLFSRSETGLLNNESGPTMPIVEMLRSGSIQR